MYLKCQPANKSIETVLSRTFEYTTPRETNQETWDFEREMRPLNNSDGFWWRSSGAYEGSNSTVLEQEKSKLNFLALKLGNTTQALCTRVDPEIDDEEVTPLYQALGTSPGRGSSDADSEDGDGDEDSGSQSGENSDSESAASRVVIGMAGFVGLVITVMEMV